MSAKPSRVDQPGLVEIRLGCAGWSLPGREQARFAGPGSHLERYAGVFGAAEINSSFHRTHQAATYARWAEAVPVGFRFSVKMPKAITHALRLENTEEPVQTFVAGLAALGEKLGCLLVQLPPSLQFDGDVAGRFFALLRGQSPAALACEPRHESWFGAAAETLLEKYGVARVAADPARVPAASEPGGWQGLSYYRWHGSPRMYYSSYEAEILAALAARLRAEQAAGRAVWCIFDNTAAGAAVPNALDLQDRLATPL